MTTDTPQPISSHAQSIIAAFQAGNQQAKLAYTSAVEVAAKHKGSVSITKYVEGLFQAGIDYASLPAVQAGVASGERQEPKSLPWGEWAVFPWIIKHKDAEYLRFYPIEGQKATSRYELTVDGQTNFEATKEEVAAYLTPANAAKLTGEGGKVDCITKKVSEIAIILN